MNKFILSIILIISLLSCQNQTQQFENFETELTQKGFFWQSGEEAFLFNTNAEIFVPVFIW